MELNGACNKFERYVGMMDDLYSFVMLSMDMYNEPHDYGTGDVLNMVEMHTLDMVAASPGLCVSDVAKMWNRSLGAASKNVNRLEKRGFIVKKKLPGNDKTVHLYPTETGSRLALCHRRYDHYRIAQTIEYLLRYHPQQELDIFAGVIGSCLKMYADRQGEWKRPYD